MRSSRSRSAIAGAAAGAALIASALVPLQASAAPNAYDTFTEYTSLPLTAAPFDLVTGPDGNIWYTAPGSDLIAQMDPSTGSILKTFSQPGCAPTGITMGPDGRLFVACFNGNQILGLTSAGVMTHYGLPPRASGTGPEFLTAGPDGFLWFTEVTTGYVAKLNVSTGSLWEYPLPYGSNADPRAITVGSDGNIWFTESGANLIGQITPSGVIKEFFVPTTNSQPFGITTGPDGSIYYTEMAGNKIGAIIKDGCCNYFNVDSPIPTADSGPRMIAVGPDGNLWFAERDAGKIGSMTPAKQGQLGNGSSFQDALVPAGATSHPFAVATGTDGNLWFTEEVGNKIGKVGTRHNIVILDKTAIGFGNVQLGATTNPQRVTITNHGPDSVQQLAADLRLCFALGCPLSSPFHIVANTCQSLPLVSGSSCYLDLDFTAGSTPGSVNGTLDVTTSASVMVPYGNPADAQHLAVSLEADVGGPAPTCTSTALSTDLPSPQNVGATVTLSSTSAGCPDANPLYSFWLNTGVPQGAFFGLQGFSPSNSFVWNTAGYAPGTYQLGVWVKDANSPNSYDAYASSTFTLGLPTCSSTNMTSDVASPQAVGATVNFTATSIGCPSPLYQWFVRDTAGNWNVVTGHDFAHSSATFAWNTTGLPDGTYQVGVWAKQTGSTNSYDAFAFVTYTLTVTHCTAVNLGTSMTSPQGTGAAITLTPTVTGCGSPQYRFYVRDAAGTWHIQQDFGVGATYVWNSSSTPVNTTAAGTFLLGVWAKQTGSANSYDAFAFITFSLTSGPTCTVNIAADKVSPQTLSTTVTWTATANSCPVGPLKYQFWTNPPNGTWGIVQPFSTTNTFAWIGATAGTYQVGVWVKQAGSTALYDNFALTTFTLTPNPAQLCGSVGITPSVTSPQLVGTGVSFTAVANGCSSAQFQWWIRDASANWAVVQDFAHSRATLAWNTTGHSPGTYLVGVWARQAGSTASYEAYSIVTFTLSIPVPQVCSSAGISPSVASPQTPGTTITFAASTLGCNNPEYRFLIALPNLSSFSEVQPFGNANTFGWNTSGFTSGTYQVEVQTRQHGSTASYEALAIITFDLHAVDTPCTTLTVWPTRGSPVTDLTSQGPQPVGTAITWMASASGCGTAEYKFFLAAPGSQVLVLPYSSAGTATWNTAGLPAGNYGVIVLARFAGSSNPFDVGVGLIYELA